MKKIIMLFDEFFENQKEIEEQLTYEMQKELRFKVVLIHQWNAFEIESAKVMY